MSAFCGLSLGMWSSGEGDEWSVIFVVLGLLSLSGVVLSFFFPVHLYICVLVYVLFSVDADCCS